ncbi:SusC/RagA family TonB-linked outer membrane protein [Segatella bryantii]|uniref:SusC/RagA family TonB-linked outer membrane protein n=1 Tax=Segatella bryantii TaxID=77095 RepID=UPI001EDA5ACD|nr:TonB-dependent receptor [Segatella bryantii]UKK82100.1 TonB-dependent receptor [Segatella bryantii]
MIQHLGLKGCFLLASVLSIQNGWAVSLTSSIETVPLSVEPRSESIEGRVVDAQGKPIVGAIVVEKGSTVGTVTDIDGKFNLPVKVGSRLLISYLGYQTKEVKAQSHMLLEMTDDNAQLDEVVVVGYGQQKKVNLTGAVANVDLEKTIGSRPAQDVAKALQGAVPGLTIINSNGSIDASPTLSIRGLGTLSNSQQSSPLVIVDGVPCDDMSLLNGNDIASISVLKDASSSAIYGSRAAFGVILITTKQANKGDKIKIRYDMQFGWDKATILPDFPSVATQLEAGIRAKARAGESTPELFGMYFDELLPYAKAWEEQDGGKKGYSLMQPYQSMDAVGDYRFDGAKALYYADYDIQDIWYNSHAPSTSHNLSISGSSNKTTYYFSAGYDRKVDIMKIDPDRRQRFNATLHLKTDLTDWLTIGLRSSFSRKKVDSKDTYSSIYQYIWRWGSYFVPSGYIEDVDGSTYDYRFIAMQKGAGDKSTIRDVLQMQAYAKAYITHDITLNADFTYQIENDNIKTSTKSIFGMNWSGTTPVYIVNNSNSSVTKENGKADRWTANAYLNYAHLFADKHNLNVMVGVNAEKLERDNFSAMRTQLYDENYPEFNLTYGDMAKAKITSATQDRASAGVFGRINYDYKGIYLLELNGRYDGSSRFREGHKWAFFPSLSAGYRFSEEKYFSPVKNIVSNGKLRFSFGQIGNEAVGDNMFLSTLEAYQTDWFVGTNQLSGLKIPTWVSPSLTWERIQTTNFGIDLGFLNNEFTLSFDLFQRLTKDMLAPGNALPSSVGAEAPYTNAGQLRSRGWELALAWRKQWNKNLSLYANFSISDTRVRVTRWNNTSQLVGHTGNTAYAYEGENWGDIWGFETDRYFTEEDFEGQNADGSWNYKAGIADQTGIQTGKFVFGPGDIKYKDLNGDGKINGGKGTLQDHGDLKVIGNQLPRYEYSFHLGGAYKGIDLDLFFQGVGKRDMWTISSFAFPLMRNADLALYANQTSYNIYDPANGIVNINQNNDFPCLWPGNDVAGNVAALADAGGSNNYYPQSRYLVDMSYLRLKSVTLGYTLPEGLTRKAHIESLRIYTSANNLFLLHKGNGNLPLDPEINDGNGIDYGGWGRTTPITRSWVVGLQVTF